MSVFLKLDSDKDNRKNRSKLEIVRDILLVSSDKVRKTRIMYQANLSYHLIEKYLGNLIESGLVQRDRDSFYLITGRGQQFLQMYGDYLKRRRMLRKEINEAKENRLLLEDMCFNCEKEFRKTGNR